jgi:outer membrane protein OmpA-like peptidoglycan-associated protein/outer membrane protein W
MRAVWRYPVLALVALGVLGIPNPARAQNAAAHTDEDNNFFELNIYGGYSDYKKIPAGLGAKITGATIFGGRVTENFWNHVGIEEDFNAYSWNKYTFLSNPTDGAIITAPFPIHTFQPAVDVVLHFTPRDHKFRPFVLAGVGGTFDVLGKNAVNFGNSFPPSVGFGGFKNDERFQGNYGGGIKYQMSKWWGVRFDVRGLTGIAPSFGLPSGPPSTTGVYILKGSILNGIQVTGGLTLYLGHRGELPAPPPPPPPPPAPRVLGAINPGAISASPTTVCPGDAVRLSSNASDPEGHQLTYQWSANGSSVGTGAQYTYTPNSSGDVRIGLHVADSTDASRGADASPVSIHVNTYRAPTVSGVTANPSSLDRGQTSALHVTAMGSDCSGRLTYSWAAVEGAVSGSGADAQFNSSSVSFNEGDRSRPQSKQVTVTATVTDSKGGSASASTNITVNFGAEIRHFGDILFPKESARVNNCGKRVLIEQLYPLLAGNPNYDVVLVGHIDSNEAPKGKSRSGRDLDRNRVLQTAAVLSGGSGTCSSLDVSRIKGSWVGATQETESLPTSCAVSTTAPKERRGAAIEDSSESKNRRVEIWLVPKGMALPAAARDGKELPDADLKKIGCPK